MKYRKTNSIILGIVLLSFLLCFAGNISDNPDEQVKAKTENGNDTLITVKK